MKDRENRKDKDRVEERTGQGRGGGEGIRRGKRSAQFVGVGHSFRNLCDMVKVEMIDHMVCKVGDDKQGPMKIMG